MTYSQSKPALHLLLIFTLAWFTTATTLTASLKSGTRIVTKTHQQLNNIILRGTYLENATLTECRNFLVSRSIELDEEVLDPSKKGISITIIAPPTLPHKAQNPPLITYNARNVSINTAITEIAKRSRHDLYITSAGIVFCPPGTPPFPNKLAKEGQIWNTLHKHKNPVKK